MTGIESGHTPKPAPVEDNRSEVVALERECAAGWPGLEQHELGDWLLRAGGGFTGRANSALILGSPGIPIAAAVAATAAWYADRGLPARFQVPTRSGDPALGDIRGIDDALAEAGYPLGDAVAVLTAECDGITHALVTPDRTVQTDVQSAGAPDDSWLRLYHYRGNPLPSSAYAVLTAGIEPFFVTLSIDKVPAAVCRGIVTDAWLGITAVTVEPTFRRRGLATATMRAAIAEGRSRGATKVYLQVSRDNDPALALYERLGFTEHHGYHYRDPR